VGGKHDAPVVLPPRTNPGIHWIVVWVSPWTGLVPTGTCTRNMQFTAYSLYRLT